MIRWRTPILSIRRIQVLRRHKFLPALWLLCTLGAWAGSVWAQGSNYQAAMNLVQKREFDQAILLLQQILDRSPVDLKARNLLGIALSGAGKREEANEQFEKVLALDPKFVPALKNMAVNELALGRQRDAKLHFEAALKLMPRDPACHWGLAEIAFVARDFERAVDHYEQSGDMGRKDPRVTIKFATSYLEAKQPAKATALLENIPSNLSEAEANTQVPCRGLARPNGKVRCCRPPIRVGSTGIPGSLSGGIQPDTGAGQEWKPCISNPVR